MRCSASIFQCCRCLKKKILFFLDGYDFIATLKSPQSSFWVLLRFAVTRRCFNVEVLESDPILSDQRKFSLHYTWQSGPRNIDSSKSTGFVRLSTSDLTFKNPIQSYLTFNTILFTQVRGSMNLRGHIAKTLQTLMCNV